jgi:hypothetical protein
MTNKELQKLLSKYLDDTQVMWYSDKSGASELQVDLEKGWFRDNPAQDVLFMCVKE